MYQIIYERSKDLLNNFADVPIAHYRWAVYLPMEQGVTGIYPRHLRNAMKLRDDLSFDNWDITGGPLDRPNADRLFNWQDRSKDFDNATD